MTMSRTQYYTATTLDGFIADENHSLEWLFQVAEPGNEDYPEFIARVGALAMGASTYEWVRAHLASKGEAWPYEQPSWVFSHHPHPAVPGADIHFVQGHVAPVHRDMLAVAGDRNIWVVGGGDLVGQFHDAGLLDEIIVTIASATLGAGKPLLPRRIGSSALKLVSAQRINAGFAQLRYDVVRDQGSGPAVAP
jgi:dihydrofolate reductase